MPLPPGLTVPEDLRRVLTRTADEVHSIHEEMPEIKSELVALRKGQQDQAFRLDRHERRIVHIEDRLSRGSAGDTVHQHFDPDLTPGGGIRIGPDMWDEINKKIDRQEAEKRGAEKALLEARESAADLRHKLAWAGGLIAALAASISYLFTHFGKL
jgi:hypothetical protein